MNNLEDGYEERLRKRMQVMLLGWCISCHDRDKVFRGSLPASNFTLKYIIAAGYFADIFCCWAPVPVGAGTIAIDPTFGSFTLLKPVSQQVN
jgi:hypothetical protein